jgi:hypothetical protein
MRALLLVIAVAACRIPNEHYSTGGGDAHMDTPTDGAQGPMTKGYIFDVQQGIFRVTKDPLSGNLAKVPVPPTGVVNAFSGVVNHGHLYVLVRDPNNPMLQDMSIASDGSLTVVSSKATAGCTPSIGQVDPTGKWLVMSCVGPAIAVAQIASDGSIASVSTSPQFGTTLVAPAFDSTGRCLFFTDSGATGTANNVIILKFDPASGTPTAVGGVLVSASATAIAAHPTLPMLYVGTETGKVHMLTIGAGCSLVPDTTNILAGDQNAQYAIVAPDGTNLFVVGSGVYAYLIDVNGAISQYASNPFLVTGGNNIFGAIMDPKVKDLLYLSSATYGGSLVAKISSGNITMQTQVSTGSMVTVWLALAP